MSEEGFFLLSSGFTIHHHKVSVAMAIEVLFARARAALPLRNPPRATLAAAATTSPSSRPVPNRGYPLARQCRSRRAMTHHVVARAEGSSEGDSASTIEDKIRSLNASHGVVIYSKSWCPFCSQAKQVFDGLGQEYFALELDEIEEGADVQDALMGMTGVRTVPQVFVGGEFVGGCDDTKAALAGGTLQKLVSKL